MLNSKIISQKLCKKLRQRYMNKRNVRTKTNILSLLTSRLPWSVMKNVALLQKFSEFLNFTNQPPSKLIQQNETNKNPRKNLSIHLVIFVVEARMYKASFSASLTCFLWDPLDLVWSGFKSIQKTWNIILKINKKEKLP